MFSIGCLFLLKCLSVIHKSRQIMLGEEGNYIMEKLHTVFYQGFKTVVGRLLVLARLQLNYVRQRNTVKIRWEDKQDTFLSLMIIIIIDTTTTTATTTTNKNNNSKTEIITKIQHLVCKCLLLFCEPTACMHVFMYIFLYKLFNHCVAKVMTLFNTRKSI